MYNYGHNFNILINFIVDLIDYNALTLVTRKGGGSYGEVWLGTWQRDPVAIKKLICYDLTADSLLQFKKEVEIWKYVLKIFLQQKVYL